MSVARSAPSPAEAASGAVAVVVDLGSHSKKRLAKLREGQGRLAGQIQDLLAQLRAEGTIGDAAEPVVVVVKEKARRLRWSL